MIFLKYQNKVQLIQSIRYCSQKTNKKIYSNTLFLPKTKFPLRLDPKKLKERDEKVANEADFENLYLWQRSHLSEPEFILHDGPPYANGKLHMGHAINKILKDTIIRFEMLKGNKVHYVPGWDCHGLPIEMKALNKVSTNPVEIRTKARQFAEKTVKEQMDGFKSWGVIGDWHNHYATYNPNYYKTQFKLFHRLYEKKLIYRDFKPVYWSPSSQTALAEAELEYNDNYKSPSAYVRFQLKNMSLNLGQDENVYAIIWTTTPWTLPSNQAVCYNPSLKYSLVKKKDDNNKYIVASDLIENLSKIWNCNLEILQTFKGDILSTFSYIHPIYKDKELKFYPASHVTVSKGTGLVHTAPAHGPEDFLVALNNNIPIISLVNELGCYTESTGDEFKGKFVLKQGNETVLHKIKDDLIHLDEIVHSYPLDWRTKKPVILRASKQWFLDTNSIKSRAVEILDNINIYPKFNSKKYKEELASQIQKRPYWCISRQRKWGVPIPVFFNKSEDPIINEDIIRHLKGLVDTHGTDFWWNLNISQLLPTDVYKSVRDGEITKSEDILDIWFDSGISWANVLDGIKVADMYLEGVDQFTGWFQSSLITSVALRDKAPYKNLYVHGFAVDDKGRKMSKSLGNVVDPYEIVYGGKGKKAYGVDVLRWWVTCHANQDSVALVSANVLQNCADEIQKIRGTLRFALGCLEDYPNTPQNYQGMAVLDKYILHLLFVFYKNAQEAVTEYQFNKIGNSINSFLTNSISALYFTAIKDRLYCDPLESSRRRSSQFVLMQIFEIVSQVCAPIVPHLVEEMYSYLPQKQSTSYFMVPHSKPNEQWLNPKIEKVMNVFLNMRKQINKDVGTDNLEQDVTVEFSSDIWKLIKEQSIDVTNLSTELQDIFQVSSVKILPNKSDEEFRIQLEKSNKFPCPRCRLIHSRAADDLCLRCNEVIENGVSEKIQSI